MSGLFKNIYKMVCSDLGCPDYGSRNAYADLASLIESKDDDGAADLLESIYTNIHKHITDAIHERRVSSSKPRGRPKKELALSLDRLTTIRQKVEQTLERTVVTLVEAFTSSTESYKKQKLYYNQFNITGGVGGSQVKNWVDLIKFSPTDSGSKYNRLRDLIEIKEWNTSQNSTPESSAMQLFVYYCAASILSHIDPHRLHQPWPNLDSARLWVMAPYEFFGLVDIAGNGFCPSTTGFFGRHYKIIELFKTKYNHASFATFMADPLTLDAAISRVDFLDCFDMGKIDALVKSGRSASSALGVLKSGEIPRLKDWVKTAFSPL
jgi:hypothetical protein